MWTTHHPDFEIKLWTETDLSSLHLQNADVICDLTLNPALRADFLRLELLYQFGGIYADIDMTCEKSLVPLISSSCFIAGLALTQAFEINNGIILSSQSNLLVSHLILKLRESF